eukprot:TRINITY_DN5728_c0_g1_i1.p1 TRINITY_DN5728_c0_g1~~TRINITY_DN5728_c0_g1_i1.p1  ORF type:complete len:123 (-),score=26.37 TRINITY_DN5728_c0_g1_i1:126-494(-)
MENLEKASKPFSVLINKGSGSTHVASSINGIGGGLGCIVEPRMRQHESQTGKWFSATDIKDAMEMCVEMAKEGDVVVSCPAGNVVDSAGRHVVMRFHVLNGQYSNNSNCWRGSELTHLKILG